EKRVIAEPSLAPPLSKNPSAYLTCEDLLHSIGRYKGHGAHKRRLASFVRDAIQLGQQFAVVGAVVGPLPCKSCGNHTGAAIEGINNKSRIIGQCRQSSETHRFVGLLEGIL